MRGMRARRGWLAASGSGSEPEGSRGRRAALPLSVTSLRSMLTRSFGWVRTTIPPLGYAALKSGFVQPLRLLRDGDRFAFAVDLAALDRDHAARPAVLDGPMSRLAAIAVPWTT